MAYADSIKISGNTISDEKGEIKQVFDFREGLEVWACAYHAQSTNTNRKLFQIPIRGIISGYARKMTDRDKPKPPSYFIPYSRNEKPVYSKAVSLLSRKYTETPEECIRLYNALVKSQIAFHEKEIEELKEYLIDGKEFMDGLD